jgi:hypothetical protein
MPIKESDLSEWNFNSINNLQTKRWSPTLRVGIHGARWNLESLNYKCPLSMAKRNAVPTTSMYS